MVKVKITDKYNQWSLNLGNGIVLINDGSGYDVPDIFSVKEALSKGILAEDSDKEKREEDDEENKEKKQGEEVWIFAEQRNNKIARVVFELLGKGRELADKLNVNLGAILLCDEEKDMPDQLIKAGADKVYVTKNDLLKNYQTDIYTKVISGAIKQLKPQIVVYGATHIGRDLGPRVAQRITTGLTADCTGLDIDNDKLLLQTRPAFGGNIMAQIKCPKHKPQMATARPGVFKPLKEDSERKGKIIDINIELDEDNLKTRVIDIIKEKKKNVNLESCRIIVSAGRGIGQKENLEIIKEFAELLGAELGASRAIVDAGWIPKDHQVGQTGKTVSPELYIACGISGAIQHRAGMQNSEMIVAINKDPNAMIFSVADYGIVGDINKIIPALIKELKEETD